MTNDLVLVNLFTDLVASMVVKDIVNGGNLKINFIAGRESQILERLKKQDSSRTEKNTKYPLVAMYLPIPETKNPLGFYSSCKIKRISIINQADESKSIQDRFKAGGNFDTVLYPMYDQFLICLANAPAIISMAIDSFIHKKMDNPGPLPTGVGLSDFVDTIEIFNLELSFTKPKAGTSGGSSGSGSTPVPEPPITRSVC